MCGRRTQKKIPLLFFWIGQQNSLSLYWCCTIELNVGISMVPISSTNFFFLGRGQHLTTTHHTTNTILTLRHLVLAFFDNSVSRINVTGTLWYTPLRMCVFEGLAKGGGEKLQILNFT
jgi:hypothetical protein